MQFLKKESVYNNVRLVCVVLMLLYAILRQNVTALQPYLMSDILNVLVMAAAGLLFVWDLAFFRNGIRTKYIWILAALFACTLLSTAIHIRYGLTDNLKAAANLFIQFFVLYAVGSSMSRQRIDREIKVIGTSIGVVWFIAVVISLFMYFADITYTQVHSMWGKPTETVQGFVHVQDGAVVMRLWGVFIDPNFAAAVSIIVICLSLYILTVSRWKWAKAFHIANIAAQFFYIVLSNSRMALVVLAVIALVGGWYLSLPLLKKRRKPGIMQKAVFREAVCLLIGAATLCSCYLCVQVTKKALPYVRYGIDVLTSGTASDGESTAPDVEELNREDIENKDDVSNGRFDLWASGVQVFLKHPILGVGPRTYHAAAKEIVPDTKIADGYSVHNSFIELLMGNGAVGFGLMLVFFILCVKDAIRQRCRGSRSLLGLCMLMLAVLSCLCCGMFISSLFYYLSGPSMLIFVLLGYAINLTECEPPVPMSE